MLIDTPQLLLSLLVLLLCGIGAWLSAQLLKRHDNIWQKTETDDDTSLFARLCRAASVGRGKGCDATSHSVGSELPIPLPRPHRDLTVTWRYKWIPTAFVGLVWFTTVAIWLVFAGAPGEVAPAWHQAIVAVAALAALASIGLTALMLKGNAPWCGGCALTHLVNILLTGAIVLWQWRGERAEIASSAHPAIASVLRAAAVAAFAVVGLFLYRRAHLVTRDHLARLQPFKDLIDSAQHDDAFLVRNWMAQPKIEIPSREGFAGDGPRVVVFTDFECPGCFCAARELRDLAEQAFAGRLHVEVRHFPLCTTCNDKIDHDPHGNACDAAYAAEAARILGGKAAFERMHDQLFMHGRRLGPETYRELAHRTGLDADLLIKTMATPAVRDIVRADVQLADAIGVTGTPVMYFDGRLVPAICRTPRFWQAVAEHRERLLALPIAPSNSRQKAVA